MHRRIHPLVMTDIERYRRRADVAVRQFTDIASFCALQLPSWAVVPRLSATQPIRRPIFIGLAIVAPSLFSMVVFESLLFPFPLIFLLI